MVHETKLSRVFKWHAALESADSTPEVCAALRPQHERLPNTNMQITVAQGAAKHQLSVNGQETVRAVKARLQRIPTPSTWMIQARAPPSPPYDPLTASRRAAQHPAHGRDGSPRWLPTR